MLSPSRATRFALSTTALLIVSACGGSGGGADGGGGGGAAPPPPPVALAPQDDEFAGLMQDSGANPLDVLANDGNAPAKALQCVSKTLRGGLVSVTDGGSGVLYTPPVGFSGEDRFVYRAADGNGVSGSARVKVRVQAGPRDTETPPAPAGTEVIELGVPVTRMQSYDTPSVLTPGRSYRVGKKPLKGDRLFVTEPEEFHHHRLPLLRSQRYSIHVRYRNDSLSVPPSTNVHPTIELLDARADSMVVQPTTFNYESHVVDFRPKRSETHFLVIASDKWGDDPLTSYGAGAENSYTVHVEIIDDNAGTSDTAALAGGAYPVAGLLETASDQDWFRVNLLGGEPHDLILRSDDPTRVKTLTVRAADAPGVILGSRSTDPATGEAVLRQTFGATGQFADYFLVVQGGSGGYRVSTEGGDVPSDVDTYGRIAVGGQVSGLLGNSPDSDWYGTYLEAGRAYRAFVYSFPNREGELRNPAIGVYDANGRVLYQASQQFSGTCTGENCNVAAFVQFSAPYSGWYFLEAARYDRFSSGGIFRLQVVQDDAPPADDFAQRFNTIGRIETRELMTGVLESASDRDWFELPLYSGEQVTVHLESDSVAQPGLRLLTSDPAGASVLAEGGPDGFGGYTLRYRALTAPQTLGYIEVYSPQGQTGRYALRREGGDVSHDPRRAEPIGTGDALAGQLLDSVDEDVYRVALTAGEQYLFELTPDVDAPVPAQDYPALMLLDTDGAPLASGADTGGVALQFLAAQTATHFLRVSSSKISGAAGGAYLLRVRNTTSSDSCQ